MNSPCIGVTRYWWSSILFQEVCMSSEMLKFHVAQRILLCKWSDDLSIEWCNIMHCEAISLPSHLRINSTILLTEDSWENTTRPCCQKGPGIECKYLLSQIHPYFLSAILVSHPDLSTSVSIVWIASPADPCLSLDTRLHSSWLSCPYLSSMCAVSWILHIIIETTKPEFLYSSTINLSYDQHQNFRPKYLL